METACMHALFEQLDGFRKLLFSRRLHCNILKNAPRSGRKQIRLQLLPQGAALRSLHCNVLKRRRALPSWRSARVMRKLTCATVSRMSVNDPLQTLAA